MKAKVAQVLADIADVLTDIRRDIAALRHDDQRVVITHKTEPVPQPKIGTVTLSNIHGYPVWRGGIWGADYVLNLPSGIMMGDDEIRTLTFRWEY